MLRAEVRTVKIAPAALFVLAVVAATFGTGCFARRYPGLMEKHLEVLSSYAAKLTALAQDEQKVAAQDWGEFTYPLERAREFDRVAAARYPERPSRLAFERALAAYADLVADPAILASPDAAGVVAAKARSFDAAAAAARAALERER